MEAVTDCINGDTHREPRAMLDVELLFASVQSTPKVFSTSAQPLRFIAVAILRRRSTAGTLPILHSLQSNN